MRFQRFKWVLRDGEVGGEGGGGSGGGAPAPAPTAAPVRAGESPGETPGGTPAPAPVATEPTPAPAPTPSSVLSKQLADDLAQFHGTPEKLRVMGEDGQFDVQASLAKTAEAYNALSTRLGFNHEPPPTAPGDYKIEAPDDFKESFDTEDPGFAEFVTEAHKAGFNQAQMDVAMRAYFAHADKLAAGLIEVDQEACTAALQEVWPSADERAQNYKAADRALKAFAGERAGILDAKFGNDPDGIWLLAQIGKGLAEDSSPSDTLPSSGGMASKSAAELVTDMASKDPAVRDAAAQENLRRAQAQVNAAKAK